MDECSLNSFPDVGLAGSTLRSLILPNNHINNIPRDIISKLKVLELLNLNNNDFTRFPFLSTPVPMLKVISFVNNQIVSIANVYLETFNNLISLSLN